MPKNWNSLTDEEKSAQLTADMERMRSGGKPDIRGRPDLVEQGPIISAIFQEELRSNPEALKTLEALKAAGVDKPTALMEKAMERCMYEVTLGMDARWPQVIVALRGPDPGRAVSRRSLSRHRRRAGELGPVVIYGIRKSFEA
jgi:hypothetical protein